LAEQQTLNLLVVGSIPTGLTKLPKPVEVRLKFGAIVRLDHLDAKRQPAKDVIDKPDRRALRATVKDLEPSNAGAVVNRSEVN
jgi:hypothetical protein